MPLKEVVVKSRAYGAHTRAATGTKTPVGLNEAFAKYNMRTAVVNSTAKRVHDFFKNYGQGFKDAMLWQGMLSRMRTANTDDVLLLLKSLEGLELNSRYPLKRFAQPFVAVQNDGKGETIVTLRNGAPMRMKNGDTEYAYDVCLLLMGKKPEDDVVVQAVSDWKAVGDRENDEMSFPFVLPKRMMYCVVCLHFMSRWNGKATGTMASRGMRVVVCRDLSKLK